MNYPTYLAQMGRRRQVAIGPWGWSEDYPDAIDFLESLFHSRSIADEDANNVSFYANGRFDSLVDEAKRELVPERRKRLVSQAVELVCDEAPFAFAYTVRFYNVQQAPYVRGYRPHPVWPAISPTPGSTARRPGRHGARWSGARRSGVCCDEPREGPGRCSVGSRTARRCCSRR